MPFLMGVISYLNLSRYLHIVGIHQTVAIRKISDRSCIYISGVQFRDFLLWKPCTFCHPLKHSICNVNLGWEVLSLSISKLSYDCLPELTNSIFNPVLLIRMYAYPSMPLSFHSLLLTTTCSWKAQEKWHLSHDWNSILILWIFQYIKILNNHYYIIMKILFNWGRQVI